MRRVLVTGASGFVGRHSLAPLLERGYEVHAVARRPPAGAAPERVTWHGLDLFDASAVEALVDSLRATHLLHFAWYAEHGVFWNARENVEWVAASLQLVRRFHSAGGSRVVVAGTCAEYDWSGDCCGPEVPLRPATLYGASKNALRELLEAYARSTGLDVAWGRVFFTYGPGEQPTRVVASAARRLLAGDDVPMTSGTQIRDLLYVEDVGAAFAALLDSRVGGAVDIGTGRGVALADVVGRLAQLAGASDLLRLGALPDRDEPDRIVADARRLAEDVGWRPARSLDDGLACTLAWWRESAGLAASQTGGSHDA